MLLAPIIDLYLYYLVFSYVMTFDKSVFKLKYVNKLQNIQVNFKKFLIQKVDIPSKEDYATDV